MTSWSSRVLEQSTPPAQVVNVEELIEYVGEDAKFDNPANVAQARQVVFVVTEWVKVHTRGNGFDSFGPNDALRSVILSASARLLDNNGLEGSVSIDDATLRKAAFNGWTLPELAVLNSHRRRTA